jgi:hypothetical protein
LTEQLLPLDLELPLPYRAPHEFCDNRTLILISEGLVKGRLYVIGNTKINGGHGPSPLLKLSTMKLYASLKYGQSRFQGAFAQFSPADVIRLPPIAVVRNWQIRAIRRYSANPRNM